MKTFKTTIPNLVVPAIPGHFAAFVVYNQLKNSGFNVAPYRKGINQVVNNLPKDLISPVDRECAVLIASYMPAGGRCDENCSSPPDFCSVTRRPKPYPMFKLLEFSVFELVDFSKILISKQQSPGVGAIDGIDLYELLKRLKNLHESNTLAIGTACNCHGILNLFNIS